MCSNLDFNFIVLQLKQEAIYVFKPGFESFYSRAKAGGNSRVQISVIEFHLSSC